jgi:phosphatidylserine/phosphatidylglycerophosphate/cardiolipin synthase-like enzyme
MHNKVIVGDDTVVTGSYNFSRNGAGNAENVLLIHDPACAEEYAGYIDSLVAAYRGHA